MKEPDTKNDKEPKAEESVKTSIFLNDKLTQAPISKYLHAAWSYKERM